MRRTRRWLSGLIVLAWLVAQPSATSRAAPPTTAPGVTDKLPHIHLDLRNRQVRVDCQAVAANMPLEFICVTAGGNDYEAVLSTHARPSDIHLALLALGLTPGHPMQFDEKTQTWQPPTGPPLHIDVEFTHDGSQVRWPIEHLVRAVTTKEQAPPMTFIFDGSATTDDGRYGADLAGYVVSLCNRQYTLIDVPELVSTAIETREWECNPDTIPAPGTPVSMIIQPGAATTGPIHAAHAAPSTASAAPVVMLKIAADATMTLDDRPVTLADLPSRLARLKQHATPTVRIASAPSADPAAIESAKKAVHDVGLTVESAVPATRPSQAPMPFGG